MLVSLELMVIADTYGALTPELAVGYRAALAARAEFESLEGVSALVGNSTGAQFAVRRLLGTEQAIHVQDHGRHVYLFCHRPTGSVLRLEVVGQLLSLPPCGVAVEDCLVDGGCVGSERLRIYQSQVDDMIQSALASPVDELFSVRRFRCRPLGAFPGALCRFARCAGCGAETRLNRLYDVEGVRLCARCGEIEPQWFEVGTLARPKD